MPEVRRRGTGGTQGRLESAILAGTGAGGGHIEHTMRGLWGNTGDAQTATSVSVAGGIETYSASGEGTVTLEDLPAGLYLVRAQSRVQFASPSTDLYHRVDIGDELGPNGGAAAPAGHDLVAANMTAVVITVAPGDITARAAFLDGPGASTEQDTTVTATRIG